MWIVGAMAAAAVATYLVMSAPIAFDARVARPAFASDHGPTILFDAAHHNRHRIDDTYRPFAKLLRNDGFQLRALSDPLSAATLAKGRIVAVVTAESDTQTKDSPAFSAAEVSALIGWIRQGGSLLLVTDHAPYPNAVETVAQALGLEVAKGMTFDAKQFRAATGDESRLIFSTANGLLGAHPITAGRNPKEAVRTVETFTGDAFKLGPGMTPLLTLSPTAISRTGVPTVRRSGGDVLVTTNFVVPHSVQGWVQGGAFPLGKGRVVVLAEAAMISAQEDNGRKLGMNSTDNDNKQFLLNLMRWLGRAL
ncbi:MAG: hypothetical protein ABIS38_06615 [Sphingomicrobium sp.]